MEFPGDLDALRKKMSYDAFGQMCIASRKRLCCARARRALRANGASVCPGVRGEALCPVAMSEVFVSVAVQVDRACGRLSVARGGKTVQVSL